MMKTNTSSLPYLALAASLLALAPSPTAFGQTTAATTPVGLMKVTIPAASSTTTPKKTTLSVPLYGTADLSALVVSVDSINQFTLAGATWTANQFADPTAPRLARIMASATAAHVGKFFLVSGNTTNGQLQVVLPSGVSTVASAVGAGDTCEVVPANTLGTLFGTTSTPFATGSASTTADNLQLYNGTGWDTYFHNGTSWVKNGDPTAASQNNEVVFPDEGIFVWRRLTTSLALTLPGRVPSTAEQSSLAAAVGTTLGTTFLADRFPLGTTLDGLALQNTANWTSNSSASKADNVLIWSGTKWVTYYFNGSQWKQSGKSGNKGSTAIPVNTAVQVVRHSTLPSALTQALPYTL